MKKLTKMLFVALLTCASVLPLSSAQAWWGGPGGGGPWGYRDWTDGFGDMLGDLWGDAEFWVHFSARGRGHGYGDYYNHYGYGPYGYPGHWGGYPAHWGGYPAYRGAYPAYGMPYALPVAQPRVITAGEK